VTHCVADHSGTGMKYQLRATQVILDLTGNVQYIDIMKKKPVLFFLLSFLLIPASFPLFSERLPDTTDYNYAQVISFSVTGTGERRYTFSVTLQHNDQGWDHYADAWEIIDADTDRILATRILSHPHVNEQPFTRSLDDVIIPAGTERILIRGKCNVHGYGGNSFLLDVDNLPEEGMSLITQ
jgi:hypothetical protein